MISVSHTVGRLAEIRMTSPITSEDLATMQRDVAVILSRFEGRLVVCADLSGATIFPSDLADRLTRFFRASNARLERTAIVVGGGATFFLQVERLLREGSSRGDTPSSSRDSSREHAPSRDHAGARGASHGGDPHLTRRAADKGSDPNLSKRVSERRAFRTTADATSWLDEVLTFEERTRLRLFLGAPRA